MADTDGRMGSIESTVAAIDGRLARIEGSISSLPQYPGIISTVFGAVALLAVGSGIYINAALTRQDANISEIGNRLSEVEKRLERHDVTLAYIREKVDAIGTKLQVSQSDADTDATETKLQTMVDAGVSAGFSVYLFERQRSNSLIQMLDGPGVVGEIAVYSLDATVSKLLEDRLSPPKLTPNEEQALKPLIASGGIYHLTGDGANKGIWQLALNSAADKTTLLLTKSQESEAALENSGFKLLGRGT